MLQSSRRAYFYVNLSHTPSTLCNVNARSREGVREGAQNFGLEHDGVSIFVAGFGSPSSPRGLGGISLEEMARVG